MKALLSGTLAIIFVFFLASKVVAAVPPTFSIDQGNYLLQASALGKNLNENVNVKNLSDVKQTLTISFSGYSLAEQDVVNQSYLTKHSIDFFTLPLNSVELEPNASATIPISFNPPSTYPAGDYLGSLTLKSSHQIEAVNFTVRILGQLKEGSEFREIIYSNGNLVYKIANTGTITSTFVLKSRLSNFLSQEEKLTSGEITIRPGEIKTVTIKYDRFWPGFVQSQTSLIYGQKQTQTTKLYSFWIHGEIIVVVCFVVLVFSLILGFILKRKRA